MVVLFPGVFRSALKLFYGSLIMRKSCLFILAIFFCLFFELFRKDFDQGHSR